MAKTDPAPFFVKDCAAAAIATGRRAQNLRELRDHLLVVHPGSIYHHFWGALLRPGFEDPEYNNDFASWARHALHDAALAERLAVVDPAQFDNMEDLRQELVDEIEDRLDETEFLTWARRDQQFHFIRAQTVVFDTKKQASDPNELARLVPTLSTSSIFYHFVDARRRVQGAEDDFRAWLAQFGPQTQGLHERLAAVDPYFTTLVDMRTRLAGIFEAFLAEEAA